MYENVKEIGKKDSMNSDRKLKIAIALMKKC